MIGMKATSEAKKIKDEAQINEQEPRDSFALCEAMYIKLKEIDKRLKALEEKISRPLI